MNYTEFKRHLGKAGISIDKFSGLLGIRANSVSNYAKKDNVPNQYAVIAVLMGDSADRGIDVLNLLLRFNIHDYSSFESKVTHIDSVRAISTTADKNVR